MNRAEKITDMFEAGKKPVGKGQIAIMNYLTKNSDGNLPVFQFTDMTRYPTFVGMGFGAIMKAAETLSKKGMIYYDGVNISLDIPVGTKPPKKKGDWRE